MDSLRRIYDNQYNMWPAVITMPTVRPFRPEVKMKSYPIPPAEPRDVRQRVARFLLQHADTYTGRRTSVTTDEMVSVMGINRSKASRAMIKFIVD